MNNRAISVLRWTQRRRGKQIRCFFDSIAREGTTLVILRGFYSTLQSWSRIVTSSQHSVFLYFSLWQIEERDKEALNDQLLKLRSTNKCSQVTDSQGKQIEV